MRIYPLILYKYRKSFKFDIHQLSSVISNAKRDESKAFSIRKKTRRSSARITPFPLFFLFSPYPLHSYKLSLDVPITLQYNVFAGVILPAKFSASRKGIK